MKNTPSPLLFVGLLLVMVLISPGEIHAQENSIAAGIQAINALRAHQGMAYSRDDILSNLNTGTWLGDPAPTASAPSAGPTYTPQQGAEPTPVPVVESTPNPDGSVSHTIQQGQTLWSISAVYGISLEELLKLNELPQDPVLRPGDDILIRPSSTPTATPIGQPSPTLPVRFTHTPSPVGQKERITLVPPAASDQPTGQVPNTPSFQTTQKQPAVIIFSVAIAGGTLLLILIFSLRKGGHDE